MNFKKVYPALCFTLLVTCSDDSNKTVNSINTEAKSYYGSYVYKDEDCSSYDIQYLTIDVNGISFFDYLGDFCDDTVECYQTATYEFLEISSDTLHLILSDERKLEFTLIKLTSSRISPLIAL